MAHQIKLAYHYLISNFMYLMLVPLILTVLRSVKISAPSLHGLVQMPLDLVKCNLVTTFMCMVSLVLLGTLYLMSRPRKMYLVDFACYKPDSDGKVTWEVFMNMAINVGAFTQENVDFQRVVLERSGLGQETYLPKALVQRPPNPSMAEARKEAEMVMFGAIDELLAKTKVKAKDIGILVVNCSLFNPTPSLSAMIVNQYKLRDNVLSYNLGGMGCSASLISIDLAKDLMQVHDNTYVLVVSTENITQSWYLGNDRSMLLTNCVFRVGGAAILLSNRPTDRCRSKYQLLHTVRTHNGIIDKSYNCVRQKEDENQKIGIFLSKDLNDVAGDAIKANITTLGPLVLPTSEKLLLAVTIVVRKAFKMKIKPYMPDFKLAIEHFCTHVGGKIVLDKLEKNLKLSAWHMESSRMALYRFRNTSSSSLWYAMAYTEAKGRVKRGHRTWQIAFGAGFKSNSVVWRALRTIEPAKEKSPWTGEIDKFPIQVPSLVDTRIYFN